MSKFVEVGRRQPFLPPSDWRLSAVAGNRRCLRASDMPDMTGATECA